MKNQKHHRMWTGLYLVRLQIGATNKKNKDWPCFPRNKLTEFQRWGNHVFLFILLGIVDSEIFIGAMRQKCSLVRGGNADQNTISLREACYNMFPFMHRHPGSCWMAWGWWTLHLQAPSFLNRFLRLLLAVTSIDMIDLWFWDCWIWLEAQKIMLLFDIHYILIGARTKCFEAFQHM